MENINFRGVPTSLFLNGPKLGIVTDPQDQLSVIGFATFTGIATATVGAGGTMDSGVGIGASIVFKWYVNGTEIKDINEDNSSRATILGFTTATGYGSTITFNNLIATDSGKEVYFTADFIPTAYSQPVGTDVVAGTARSTANAINDPLQSQSAIVTLLPVIEVTSEPSGQLVSVDDDATFFVVGKKSPGDGPVEYQWQLNGNDLSDGVDQTIEASKTSSGQFTITRGSETPVVIDAIELASYGGFKTGEIYTIVAGSDMETNIFAFGADGGSDARSGGVSGKGGIITGPFTFLQNQTYKLVIGRVGTANLSPTLAEGSGGPAFLGANSGGGFTGLFINDVTQANAIMIAGGGGSSGEGNYRSGGDGGGLDANDNSAPWSDQSGASQTEGGLGFYDTRDGTGTYGVQYRFMTGTALKGGSSQPPTSTVDFASTPSDGGNGGGGYFGGGAGRGDSNFSPGPYGGGGGSSFSDSTLVFNAQSSKGGADFDLDNNSRTAGEGQFRIEIVSVSKSAVATVTGSQTENLTINTNGSLNSTIRCKLTATDVQQSPLFSNTVSYVVVEPRSLIEIETYNYTDATVTLSEFDLSDGDLTIDYASYSGNAVCLYAGDKDIDIEMEMYGGHGAPQIYWDVERGNNLFTGAGIAGGEGGYSKIRFTMETNEEYIITGLFSAVNAPFLYRKASLIAVVGAGGDAGRGFNNSSRGIGGDGGGISISGTDASTGTGLGGEKIESGELPSTGIVGSGGFANPMARHRRIPTKRIVGNIAGDTYAALRAGGRTIPCTRGVYWNEQGKSSCEDLGTIKFRTPIGTEISNTANIARGYKSGYNIIQTRGLSPEGNGVSQSGSGGAGATGGRAGTSGGGGGGGSGYTDGSITVVETRLGGSLGPAKIIIRIADPSTIDPSTTLQDVIFDITSSNQINTITFVKESGSGPDRITFGPNSGTVVVRVGFGAVYTRESVLINGAPGGIVRLTDNTLELEDTAGEDDFTDLTITPRKGRFTSDSRYEFIRASETVSFTQSRTSNENLGVTMTLVSGTGTGPPTISFGSSPGFSGTLPSPITATIQQGAVYTITSTNGVDSRTLSGSTLTFSDNDSNPGSLSVTPDNGEWTSTSRYEFT